MKVFPQEMIVVMSKSPLVMVATCVPCSMTISIFLGLKVPPVVKRRGRPKGHLLTVCGLPAKKCKGTKNLKKPTSFQLMHSSEKEKGMKKLIARHYLCPMHGQIL